MLRGNQKKKKKKKTNIADIILLRLSDRRNV